MGLKANSTIISNSALVRYEPSTAWEGFSTKVNNANVSLAFYGTDITAYGTGHAYAYQIYLDGIQITNYLQRHFEDSEIVEYYRQYYHCTGTQPSDGYCEVLLEFHNLDPNIQHTIKIRSILGSPELLEVLQWLVQYDTGIDETAGSLQQTDLWPSEGSIEYSPSWPTLVGGDKVTSKPGDTAKFTFTGSGIEIFAIATEGNRIRVELDGESQEIVPTNSRSSETVAYTMPLLYSRLGLSPDTPHVVTITNLIDSSAANPQVNVTLKRMAIWKDSGTPQSTSTTHQLGEPTGSSTSVPSLPSGGSLSGGTIAGITVGCVAFLLILAIVWFLLRSRRRRQNASVTTEDIAGKGTVSDHTEAPTPFTQAMNKETDNVSHGNRVWSIPPTNLDSSTVTYTIPSPNSGVTGAFPAPPSSHTEIEVAREVMAEQKQGAGPLSPSTLRNTDDSSSVEEERINRVILEVARRMGGVERGGMPPNYADLH